MFKIHTLRVVALIFCIAATYSTKASNQFHHLTEENGLSSRRSFSMVQDNYGYMWVATKKGVDRFDGNHTQQYLLLRGNVQEHGAIGVNKLEVSTKGEVWAYSEAGLIFGYNEILNQFDCICSLRELCKDNSIVLLDLAYDTQNNLFVIATSLGLYIYDLNSSRLLKTDVANSEYINHVNIADEYLYVASANGLYMAAYNDGRNIQQVSHTMQGVNIYVTHFDAISNRVFIGTLNRGLYYCHQGEAETITPITTLSTSKPIRAIDNYANGNLVMGIDLEGVYVLESGSDKVIHHFSSDETDANSLSSNNVRDIYIDRDDNLWVATYHSGVSFRTSRTPLFSLIKHKIRDKQSIADNNTNVTFEDSKGRQWFGTNRGVSIYDKAEDKWSHLFLNLNQEGAAIRVIKEDKQGDIWIGGYSFGVARISARDGSIRRYFESDSDPIISTNFIYDICVDGDTLWFGGIGGNITSFNTKTNEKQRFPISKISRIYLLDNEHLLLGRFSGLYLFNKVDGALKNLGIEKSVLTIGRSKDSGFWVGSENDGLYYYNFKQDSLRHFSTKNILPSNCIYGVIEDEQGSVWIGSEEGLFRLTPDMTIESFASHQDLSKVQFDRSVYTQCSDGRIILGSADGAIIFDPNEIESEQVSFNEKTHIHQFDIYNKPIYALSKNSPFTQSIHNTKEIKLRYNQNYFTFHFSTINYQTPERVLYSYYLEGYDLDWSEPAGKPSASYSRVSHGKYTFHVRTIINDIPQVDKSIEVVIQRPWWGQYWAWCLYCLVALSLIYYIVLKLRESQTRKQTESKIDFFITTAHDLLTPLNLIQEPLRDIESDVTLSQKSYALTQMALNNTMKLSHFIRQLLDFQVISLNSKELILTDYLLDQILEEQIAPFRIAASHKEITIHSIIDKSAKISVQTDRDKITRILDNIISNAIKYTNYGGSITIKAFAKGGKWRLTIKDSGMGISEREQKLIFKHIFRAQNAVNSSEIGSGIGLKLVGVLVSTLQGKISLRSKVGVGTEFTLTFPTSYNHPNNVEVKELSESKERAQTADEDRVADTHRPNIMIVDDDFDMLEYLDISLSGLYNTFLCSNGEEALQSIKSKSIDLVISDVSMPNMDGMELCRRLGKSAETSYIPILLVTGRVDRDSILEGLRAGAIDYIKKPFDKDLLCNKIENIFELQKRSQRQYLEGIKSDNFATLNSQKENEFIEQLSSLIEANLSNPELSITMLSQEMALSKTLLYNKVTQITGKSTIELIRVFRLKRAASLLLSGEYSVAEVATLVGIDNPKYFSKIFKEFYGESPKTYIAKEKK